MSIVNMIISFFDAISKIFGGIIALTIVLAFVSQEVRSFLNLRLAETTGVVGHLYYEVGKRENEDRIEPTRDGLLYLLKRDKEEDGKDFEDISVGDKVIAADSKNLWPKDTSEEGSPIFVLQPERCAIVLDKVRELEKFEDKWVSSGGWLKVATTGCGIFQDAY